MNLRPLLAIVGMWALATAPATAQPPGKSRPEVTLKAGDPAPDFKLKALDGKEQILSSYAGKKAVALIFGSCT